MPAFLMGCRNKFGMTLFFPPNAYLNTYFSTGLYMIKKLLRNPFFIYLPFLCFYAYTIVINKWPKLYGDEIRYVAFAKNLLHGFYSPHMPHINLWNGPGYPLTLVPFIAFKVPMLYTTLMNAVFLYLAVVFLYKALRMISNHRIALVAGLLLAMYPNAWSVLPILYTEPLTYLMVSAILYTVTLNDRKNHKGYLILAGLLLGLLTLVKIIFGYVLLAGIVACLGMLLVKRNRYYTIRSAKILLIAFAITVPYLVYTWQLTGKAFYWGNSGGMSLYWMSTPYANEYGDWKNPDLDNNQYPNGYPSPGVVKLLKKNHSKEVNAILKHNELEQDALFKQAAIRNIQKAPLKFVTNYYYNFARMFFNFPYSYSYQDAAILGNILRGSLILWASTIGIVLTWINRRQLIYPAKFLLALSGIYLLLSGALSAYPRQLDVMLPVLLFWMGYLAANLKKINANFAVKEELEAISLKELEGLDVLVEQGD
jgi:4-amino-4-deoxy-L-arabinose transferase-like glycosyltransferase